ncbi:uncharacterized protein [Petaurus breviceps papuanus]|uniref:uncharacterized protein isoform X3 n=1 Tax=Petaurus breviceps papuanus TaxID=3040969 RepID=UPI0036DD122B
MANSRHAQRVQQPLNYNSREALQTSGAFSKSKGERTGFPSFYVTSSSPLFFFFFVPFRGGGSQLLLLLPELGPRAGSPGECPFGPRLGLACGLISFRQPPGHPVLQETLLHALGSSPGGSLQEEGMTPVLMAGPPQDTHYAKHFHIYLG